MLALDGPEYSVSSRVKHFVNLKSEVRAWSSLGCKQSVQHAIWKNRFELEQSQVRLVGDHWKVKFRALTESGAHLQSTDILVSGKVCARLLLCQIMWQSLLCNNVAVS